MDKVFNLAEEDEKDVIHKHLLTLSALTDPTGKAREILQKEKKRVEFLEQEIRNMESKMISQRDLYDNEKKIN